MTEHDESAARATRVCAEVGAVCVEAAGCMAVWALRRQLTAYQAGRQEGFFVEGEFPGRPLDSRGAGRAGCAGRAGLWGGGKEERASNRRVRIGRFQLIERSSAGDETQYGKLKTTPYNSGSSVHPGGVTKLGCPQKLRVRGGGR